MLNYRIRRVGLARTEYFGSWEDYEFALRRQIRAEADVEIMIHPQFVDGVLVDATCGRPLSAICERAVCGERVFVMK
jgi:hypothetical protein